MMEIRLKLTFLENLFLCLCLLTGLGQANGATVIKVREGSEAVLPCFIRPEQNIERDAFEWKKNRQKVFLYKNRNHSNNGLPGQDEQFKGRVSHFPDQLQFGDASIRIRDTKESDSGTYICDFSPDEPNRKRFTIKLVVVSVVVTVREGSEAVLPCFIRPKKNIERDVFDWRKDDEKEVFFHEEGFHYNSGRDGQDEQFRGRVFHFPEQLQFGDASIRINNTRVSDRGTYSCHFPRLQPEEQIFYIELVVVCSFIKDRSEENIGGASLKPHITSLDHTRDEAKLQCEVQRVSPKPKVEWQDSSGNNLTAEEPQVTERRGSYDIILNTTVNKTDNYSCVVTQEEICHQISAVAFVFIPVLIKVKEGSETVLPCSISTKQNIEQDIFDWRKDEKQEVFMYNNSLHSNNGLPGQDEQFKGRVNHFPEQLQFGDASIRIRDTKESDSGNYTCDFSPDEPNRQRFNIDLVVVFTGPEPSKGSLAGWIVAVVVLVLVVLLAWLLYKYYKRVCSFIKDRSKENIRGEASKLFVTTFNTDDGILLQCVVQGASPKPKVEWQDSSGKILPAEEPQITERGGKYDIILRTTVTKTDRYQCVVKQKGICHQVSEEISVKIPVFTGPEPPEGEASKLTAMMHKTDNGARLLRCEVLDAFPKPKVEWKDSSGKILRAEEPKVIERGGKYYIILHTTVTKTDNYRCVVTQEEINHQVYAEIFVFIPGAWGGFKRRFCWLWRSFCNCCKKHSQTERNGNQEELVELNRNHDTSAV